MNTGKRVLIGKQAGTRTIHLSKNPVAQFCHTATSLSRPAVAIALKASSAIVAKRVGLPQVIAN
jgi:hypothetical protein